MTTLTARGLDGKPLREYTYNGSSWSWSKDYIWRQGKAPAVIDSAGTRHFALDHLGTVRLITNSDTGKTVWGYHAYYPFGEEAATTWDAERIKFTGHERDLHGSTGTLDDLDYMHARYYKPVSAERFFSVDPGRDAGPKLPQSWNLYAYVRDNPLKLTDPTGQFELWDDVIFAAGGAIVGAGTEIVSSLVAGEKINWHDVGAAAAGGAVTGWLLEYTAGLGPIGVGLAGGAGNAVQNLTSHNGAVTASLATDVGLGVASGWLPGKATKKLSLFNQMVTKFDRGLIGKVSSKTAFKMFAGRATQSGLFTGSAVKLLGAATGVRQEFSLGLSSTPSYVTDRKMHGPHDCDYIPLNWSGPMP